MRKLAFVAVLFASLATCAVADQINFNFTLGSPSSVVATAAGGLTAGPSMLTSISDTTTNTNIPTPGTFVNAITGPASSFVPIGSPPTLLLATFTGAGANSVLVVDAANNVLVAGSMEDNASLLTSLSVGTGSFLGTFDVSFVSPAALALFGLGPGFQPVGSVAFIFASANFDGTTLTGAIGGGSVTIQTPTPTPEPVGLGIVGMGLVVIAEVSKRLRARRL